MIYRDNNGDETMSTASLEKKEEKKNNVSVYGIEKSNTERINKKLE